MLPLDCPCPVVSQRRHHAHLMELAAQHHCQVLRARGLHAFKHYVHHRGKMAHCSQLARESHVRSRLQQCWVKWLQRCEHNEEIALGGLTRRARAHAASKLTHIVLAAWVQYIIQRRLKARLQLLADTHFREHTLPK